MNTRDQSPVYNMNCLLELVKSCFSSTQTSFWAKVLHEHQVNPSITGIDFFHSAMLHHLFSGACVSHAARGCESVVMNESCPESMGVHMIDAIFEWLEKGSLTLGECEHICRALSITLDASHKKRSMIVKLSDRRQHLLRVIESAAVPLPDLVSHLGGSSSARSLKSIGAAHGIDIPNTETKEASIGKIFDHVTRGMCFENAERAPGCGRISMDPSYSLRNAVHLQVIVLNIVEEAASKKQISKVLDLHEITYNPADSRKMLKWRLRKYIHRIENGKLSDADAQGDAIEKLRKLDDVRKNWPQLIPAQVKEEIIKDFRAATSSSALAAFTCACCARRRPVHDRVRRSNFDVDLNLLIAPASHWVDPSFAAPPTPFADGPLKDKLVDERGVSCEGEKVTLELCTPCSRSLHKHTLPKHALANKLYLGPVPEELKDLTMVEEGMIARARAKSWIVKLQEQGDSTLPTAQRGLKGHTIIYPQQPENLPSVLPPPADDMLAVICVIFVGSSKLTAEWLREKAKPLVVRRDKVYKALRWLKRNNPLYGAVQIDDENLRTLPENDVLSYHVEHVSSDDAQEAVVSRYDNLPSDSQDTVQSPTQFESVVIADVDAHTPMNQLRAAAVRHAKAKHKPFVQIGHGVAPVNEFFNVDLFPMMYPTLYPYGCGGFEDQGQVKRISMKEHAKYLLSLRDSRFQTHNSFLFTVFNMLQRHDMLLGCSLKVKRATFSQFTKRFSSVSSDAVGNILGRIEKGDKVSASTDEEQKVLRLMKEVNLVTAKVPGSSAARVAMRNEIRALTLTHGMPSFYITINPADAHNPIVKFLAGADIDIDSLLPDDVPSYWDQSKIIAANPVIGANFFNTYLKAFIKTVLGVKGDSLNEVGGILGTVKAHYGCVEAQGRGSLHCHMLVWIEGALNPNEIRNKVMSDPAWGKDLLNYLDDTITNVVPEDPIPNVPALSDEKDPCALRGIDLNMENTSDRLALRMKDVSRLAERVQRHQHSHTCYKYYKPGEERTCRFDLKEENFCAESSIDSETGQISL